MWKGRLETDLWNQWNNMMHSTNFKNPDIAAHKCKALKIDPFVEFCIIFSGCAQRIRRWRGLGLVCLIIIYRCEKSHKNGKEGKCAKNIRRHRSKHRIIFLKEATYI